MTKPDAPVSQGQQSDLEYSQRLAARHRKGLLFSWVCLASTCFGIIVLLVLLLGVTWQAWGWISPQFFTNYDSRTPENAGLFSAIGGTAWLIVMTAAISVPVGVGAAVYLEEFATDNRLTRLIQLNLSNLAGVPSIVYGILGLTLFVRYFRLDRSVLSGALTLSLLVLPVVIVAAQEALRSVPATLRHASLALGATEWQTIRHQVLPAAIPGILTGVILAISRAIGETAPLVMLGALTFIPFAPNHPMEEFTAMPIQIYNWIGRPQEAYQHVAAAGILVLLVVLLALNAIAIAIRHRAQKNSRW